MKFEFDHRTGMMRPKKDEEIYFAQSQGGGLIVDDKKNNIKYIIERDGRITKLFGSFDKNNLNLYDMRDARIIADRVRRLLGIDHKYTDFHYFLRGYRMSESFIKTCSDFLGESIWSDIQDRSAGDTVREEDMITTNEDLKNKIKELYKEQGEGETLDVSSLTNCIKCDDFSDIFRDFYKVKQIIGLEDWDVSKVTDMRAMFEECSSFNCDLSKWDVSSVGDMCEMFSGCINFNCDLSKWNVSSVEDMSSMFWGCENFNCDLSNWNVSSAENMAWMFLDCYNFNSDLSKWNVSNVEDMCEMFSGCKNFNCDLSNWDVSNVEDMKDMFYNCKSLKQIPSWYINESSTYNYSDFLNESIWSDIQDRSAGDTVREEDMITTNEDLLTKIQELYKEQGEGETLDVSSLTNIIKCDDFSYIFSAYTEVKHIIGLEDWDVSNVKYMREMFWGCKNFNSDLSKWDVSNVKNMSGMFVGCQSFNSDLSKWDVSSVEDMESMFDNCKKFNSDLSKWNVSNVENMNGMFMGCKKFNCNLSNWDVSGVGDMEDMFDRCESLKQIPSWYK